MAMTMTDAAFAALLAAADELKPGMILLQDDVLVTEEQVRILRALPGRVAIASATKDQTKGFVCVALREDQERALASAVAYMDGQGATKVTVEKLPRLDG